jgi:hypothetical protein
MAVEIREGTALARLIAETRTHGPEMALAAAVPSVKLDIPPWLAAHYRRNHSEMPKVAMHLDPTGGYPLVLENLHAWMLIHQDLQSPPPPPPNLAAAAAPMVGSNLKISGDTANPTSESIPTTRNKLSPPATTSGTADKPNSSRPTAAPVGGKRRFHS